MLPLLKVRVRASQTGENDRRKTSAQDHKLAVGSSRQPIAHEERRPNATAGVQIMQQVTIDAGAPYAQQQLLDEISMHARQNAVSENEDAMA